MLVTMNNCGSLCSRDDGGGRVERTDLHTRMLGEKQLIMADSKAQKSTTMTAYCMDKELTKVRRSETLFLVFIPPSYQNLHKQMQLLLTSFNPFLRQNGSQRLYNPHPASSGHLTRVRHGDLEVAYRDDRFESPR